MICLTLRRRRVHRPYCFLDSLVRRVVFRDTPRWSGTHCRPDVLHVVAVVSQSEMHEFVSVRVSTVPL